VTLDADTFSISTLSTNSQKVIACLDGREIHIVRGTTVNLDHIVLNVDTKPGSNPNSINPKSKGKITLGILSTMDFYVPAEVDAEYLTFGCIEDEQS